MKSSCPECKSFEIVPIVYGFPTEETLKRAENNEEALGGCLITDDNPEWQCNKCGYRWVEKG